MEEEGCGHEGGEGAEPCLCSSLGHGIARRSTLVPGRGVCVYSLSLMIVFVRPETLAPLPSETEKRWVCVDPAEMGGAGGISGWRELISVGISLRSSSTDERPF